MLEDLTIDTFRSLIGQPFRIHDGAKCLEVELIELQPLRPVPLKEGQAGRREPFSIVFRGAKGIQLPQHIYGVEHASFGIADIFLVPIGVDEKGVRYEAVFN